MKSETYHYYKTIGNYDVFQPYCNIEKWYTISKKGKRVSLTFHIVDGKPEIKSIYKITGNFFADRYLKKYREDKEIQAVMNAIAEEENKR